MSETQEKYCICQNDPCSCDLKKKFIALGQAIRYFRHNNEKCSIGLVAKFMDWSHSYLMDIELGRKNLTDKSIIKKLAEILEINPKILLDLANLQESFEPESFGYYEGSINSLVYHSFDSKYIFGLNTKNEWIIYRKLGANVPKSVYCGGISSNDFARQLFENLG